MSRILIVFLFFQFSCNYKNSVVETSKFLGKTIAFPEKMNLDLFPNDTKEFKIIVYIDGNCPKCLLNLKKWIISNHFNKVKSYIIIYAEDEIALKYYLQKEKISIKYFFDSKNEFKLMNELPDNQLFHTLLLNDENKVVVIGNPIYNKYLHDLYDKKINKD